MAARRLSHRHSDGGTLDRESLVTRVFRCLDEDAEGAGARGRLSSRKLRRYAELLGFDGDADEWAVEFSEMCVDYKWDARGGVDLSQFSALVSNPKEGGAYATDQELVELLQAMQSPGRAGMPQRSLKRNWRTREKAAGDGIEGADGVPGGQINDGATLTAEDVRVVLERSCGAQARIDAETARLVARMAERVMDEVVGAAAKVARHRGSGTLEVSDLRMSLGAGCGLWAEPGDMPGGGHL